MGSYFCGSVMEETGLRVPEHSYMLVPQLLALLKDEDPGVARQAIVSGTKSFCSILQELAQQVFKTSSHNLNYQKKEKKCQSLFFFSISCPKSPFNAFSLLLATLFISWLSCKMFLHLYKLTFT